jgi:hypothetical protein
MKSIIITDASTNWIPQIRNVFSKDVAQFEEKKGRQLEKQSRKNREKFLSSLMHSKFYQSRANNPNGYLPTQWQEVAKSELKLPIWLKAHRLREQEKRI